MTDITPLPIQPTDAINEPLDASSVTETLRANLLANLFEPDSTFTGILQPDPPADYSTMTPQQLANEVTQRLL